MSEVIFAIAIIVFSNALVSALEAAFFTVSISRAKVLVEQKRSGSKALLSVKERIHRSIITLVILSNAIAVGGSMYVGYLASKLYGSEIGVLSAIVTILIIFFGEIIPKMIGESYAERIALFSARGLIVLTFIFHPLVFLVEIVMKRFIQKNRVVSEDELKVLSQMGEMEGTIEADEREIIQRVFTLNDLTAKDIMTPRMVVSGLEEDATLESVSHKLYDKPYSRYPVYTHTLDQVRGVASSKTLLIALAENKEKTTVREYLQPAVFVSEKKRVDDLLAFFQKERVHMAIVQDEFGGTAGIVTLEDVLEQLVGEIMDETDEHVDLRAHARERKKK